MEFVIGFLLGVAFVFFIRWIRDWIEASKSLEERRDDLVTIRYSIDSIIEDIEDEIRRQSYGTGEERGF